MVDVVTTPYERVRLERYVVSEERVVTVSLRHEEIRMVREPVGDSSSRSTPQEMAAAPDRVIVLREERPVVSVEVVPVERVWLDVTTVTGTETIDAALRSEHIDVIED